MMSISALLLRNLLQKISILESKLKSRPAYFLHRHLIIDQWESNDISRYKHNNILTRKIMSFISMQNSLKK